MTVFTPPYAPSYGANITKEYRTLSTDFGDGYKAYTKDGINNVRETWEVSWENIGETDVNSIISALDGFAGTTFQWTTPDGSLKNFTCAKIAKTFTGFQSYNLTVTFVQSFNA